MEGEPEDYSRRQFFSFGQHFPKFLCKMFFTILLDIIGLENLLLFFHEILIQNNALVLHWCYMEGEPEDYSRRQFFPRFLHCSQPIRICPFFPCVSLAKIMMCNSRKYPDLHHGRDLF